MDGYGVLSGLELLRNFAWGENVARRFSLFARYWVRALRLSVNGREDIALSSSTTPFATPGSKSTVVCFCAFQTVIRSCISFAAVVAGSASFGSAKAAWIISLAIFVDATDALRSSSKRCNAALFVASAI